VDEKVSNQILPSIKEGSYEGKAFEVSVSQEKEPVKKQGKKRKN
jgi:hypothetical protein